MTPENQSDRNTVRLDVLYPEQPLEILHVNFVKFAHLGGNVFMDFGMIDDQGLIAARAEAKEGQPVSAIAYVIRRTGMTVETFALLKKQVEQMAEKLQTAGLLKATASSEETE